MVDIDAWQEIRQELAAHWELSEPEQAGHLAALEARDAALAQMLRQCLESQTPSILDMQVSGKDLTLVPGERVGAYQIDGFVARGGMGAVYRAHHPILKKVALKVMRPELNLATFVNRFERERDILAGLRHPYIAYLLDAGTTDKGLPFVAMEYVEGVPLNVYCLQAHRFEDLLRLYCRICDAVAFAHHNLVIHRDIKPANILIDRSGNPKLLDFGIAKLVNEPQPASDTLVSQHGVFTPEYASPEQWRQEHVGTSSDIYALGVILYELASGNRPFRLQNGNLNQLKQRVCEEEPIRPSRSDPRADTRQTGARFKIPRDLDSIVLRALRKHPSDRYPTVDSLSDDIHRLLENRPVTARRETAGYVLRKFAARHRLKFMLAGFFLTLILAAGLSWWMQRQETQAQLAKAQGLDEMVRNIFLVNDPLVQYRNPLTVNDILENAVDELDTLREKDPAAVLAFYDTVTRAYFNLGDTLAAKSMIDEMVEINRELYGRDHPNTLAVMVEYATLLYDRKEFQQSRLMAERVLAATGESQQRNNAASLPDYVFQAQFLIAGLALNASQFEEAFDAYQSLLTVAEQRPDAAYWLAEARNGMGLAAYRLGHYEEAEIHGRRAVEYLKQSGSDDPIRDIGFRNNLAITLRRKGDYKAAQVLFLENIDLLNNYGITSGEQVSRLHNNLGLLDRHLGAWEASAFHLRTALENVRKQHGRESLQGARALNNYSLAMMDQGRWDEAEAMLHEALTVRKALLPPDHWLIAAAYNNLGLTAMGKGDWSASRDAILCAQVIREKILQPDHPERLNTERFLIMLDLASGQTGQTRKRLAYVLACEEARWGPDITNPAHQETLYLLGRYFLQTDQPVAAEPVFLEALGRVENTWPANHYEVRRMVKGLAESSAHQPNSDRHRYWRMLLDETPWLPASALSYLTERDH